MMPLQDRLHSWPQTAWSNPKPQVILCAMTASDVTNSPETHLSQLTIQHHFTTSSPKTRESTGYQACYRQHCSQLAAVTLLPMAPSHLASQFPNSAGAEGAQHPAGFFLTIADPSLIQGQKEREKII